MKLNKMWLDGKPTVNPLGTSRANRNFVFNKQQGSIINEDGTLFVDTYGEQKSLIGVIALDSNDFIVFTKKSSDTSEIGYVDNNLVYKELISNNALNFKYHLPIHGTFQRNSNGEIIVIFTDGVSPLRYFNKEKTISITDINVFPDYKHPQLESYIETGGDLKSGAWYPIVQYEKDDKVVGSWIKDYNPVYIVQADISYPSGSSFDPRQGNAANLTTNKQIRLSISGIDTRFKKLRIGAVFQANNTRVYYYIKSINITGGTIDAVISTMSQMQELIADEVIIDKSKYKTVKNIAQLNNTLYLQGLGLNREPNHQARINNIRFKFKSTLINLLGGSKNFRDHSINNNQRHFQHGEVYALYIRLEYYWGWGQWRHIPGRDPGPGELNSSIDGFLRYQTEDTCGTDGSLSYWENIDEPYPVGQGYPSGNVRHIKFPSIRWMKQNVYNGDAEYGGRKLDILNLQMDQSTFKLDDYEDCEGNKAINFQIGYAKRNDTNGLIAGQSIFISSMDKVVPNKPGLKSFGFSARYTGSKPATNADSRNIRTYDFINLFNKTAPNINYVRSEVLLDATINFLNHTKAPSPYEIEDNIFIGTANFAADNNVSIPNENLSKVKTTKFIINNTILGNINNTFLEDTIHIELENPLTITTPLVANGIDENPNLNVQTHLLTLLSIKKNCYNEFYNQSIIICDEDKPNNIYGGDTYINIQNINTFGDLPWLEEKFSSDTSKSNTHNTSQNGVRIANLFVGESRYNTGFRYTNPATTGGSTQHIFQDDPIIYLPALLRDREPNQLQQGYTIDYNAQNDLTFSDIYNPNQTNLFDYKFAVTRGAPISTEGDIGSWINFKVNDVYFLNKTRGDVIFFGAAKDFLIIHHRNALFRTRTRTYIDTTGDQAFTGQGDIFENEPEEIIYDEKGALGTQHRWSCYISKYGYFWIDAEAKTFYKYDGSVTSLSSRGLINFFQENSICVDDNPFNSFGYHTIVDEVNRRLIVTKKHNRLKPDFQKSFKGIWKNDQNFINSLQQGDIVMKDGQLVYVQ